MVRDIFRQLFTESDNQTQDLFRYIALLVVVVGLGLQIYDTVWQGGKTFHIAEFSAGFAVLLTGAGAAVKLRPETPPEPPKPPTENK